MDGIVSEEVLALAAVATNNQLGPWHYKSTFEPQYWAWKWKEVTTQGVPPGPRHKHAAATISNELLLIVGGIGFETRAAALAACKRIPQIQACNELWAPLQGAAPLGDARVLHVPSMEWLDLTMVQPDGPMPPRHSHTATAAGTSVYVFGGVGRSHFADLWQFTVSTSSDTCRTVIPELRSDSTSHMKCAHRTAAGPTFALTTGGLLCSDGPNGLPTHLLVRKVPSAGDVPLARSGHTALVLQ